MAEYAAQRPSANGDDHAREQQARGAVQAAEVDPAVASLQALLAAFGGTRLDVAAHVAQMGAELVRDHAPASTASSEARASATAWSMLSAPPSAHALRRVSSVSESCQVQPCSRPMIMPSPAPVVARWAAAAPPSLRARRMSPRSWARAAVTSRRETSTGKDALYSALVRARLSPEARASARHSS